MKLRFWKRDKVSKFKEGDTEWEVRFHDRGREMFRIYPDGRVVLSAEWYEAARGFWDIVKTMAPQGYSLEVKKEL